MNEGIGSTPIVVIIVVFIAFASAYMAYNVNYTKAFRMKNKIIALYNKYDGNCVSECREEIEDYKRSIGYSAAGINCENNSFRPGNAPSVQTGDVGYCVYKVDQSMSNNPNVVSDRSTQAGYYYRVVTRINIRIPIVENVLGLGFLNVSGDTRMFKDS